MEEMKRVEDVWTLHFINGSQYEDVTPDRAVVLQFKASQKKIFLLLKKVHKCKNTRRKANNISLKEYKAKVFAKNTKKARQLACKAPPHGHHGVGRH